MDKKKIAIGIAAVALVAGGAFVFMSKDDNTPVTPVDTNQTGNGLTENESNQSIQITEPHHFLVC